MSRIKSFFETFRNFFPFFSNQKPIGGNTMPEEVAKFSAAGGNLEIEIEIGENKTGTCYFYLYDKNDTQLQQGKGVKSKNKFTITSPRSALDGATLMWEATINGPDKPNQPWSLTMTIRQDGQTLEGGFIPNDGTFQLVKVTDLFERRLEAV
jgi:hypothetical protein